MKNFVISRDLDDEMMEIFILPENFFFSVDNIKDGEIRVHFFHELTDTEVPTFEFTLKPKDYMGKYIEDYKDIQIVNAIKRDIREFIAYDIAEFLQNGYNRIGASEEDPLWMSKTFVLNDYLDKWSESYKVILDMYNHGMVARAPQKDKQ